jgi:transcriptional antiterminator NusG
MAKQDSSQDRNWYAIHTYSGYENAVARNLKQRIETLGMQNKIFDVIVPIEKKVKIKGGKEQKWKKRFIQGMSLWICLWMMIRGM